MQDFETKDIHLFHTPDERLRLTLGDTKSYISIKPKWAAPLSQPNRFLALLDPKDEEIVTIDEPKSLEPTSYDAVMREVRIRYLTSIIQQIVEAKVEFGATYWTALTDRGRRDFVTQSLQENAQWLGERHLLLVDVDGNRFEILDVEALDKQSQDYLDAVL